MPWSTVLQLAVEVLKIIENASLSQQEKLAAIEAAIAALKPVGPPS